MVRIKPIDEKRLVLREELPPMLREELRGELPPALSPTHGTFQWEHFLNYGVDAFFLARKTDLTLTESLARASDFWRQTTYSDAGDGYKFDGEFRLPRNLARVAVYSVKAYRYPQLMIAAKLPSLSFLGNEDQIFFCFGFEHGAAFFNGLLLMMVRTTTTFSNYLQAYIGTRQGQAIPTLEVYKPSDWNTAEHVYRIHVTKNLATFWIDHRPILFVVLCGVSPIVTVKENVQPYSILLAQQMPSSLTAMMEIWSTRTSEATADIVANVSPYRFRVSEGSEIEPIALPLYVEDTSTKLAGYSLSSGTLVSHPIPVFGFNSRTIFFRANQSGTVNIEARSLTGNWRTYDSKSYTADSNFFYVITGDLTLARLTYTPSTYPASIAEGEVVMR